MFWALHSSVCSRRNFFPFLVPGILFVADFSSELCGFAGCVVFVVFLVVH